MKNETRRRMIVSAGAALVTIQLTGCGGGLDFTGGSLPPGRSTIVGQVVQAEGSHTPVGDAQVTITTIPTGSNPLTYRVYTDVNGNFSVNGLPTGVVNSDVTVAVNPNNATLQSQTINFLLANQRGTNVIMAMPPAGYDLSQVAKVVVASATSSSVGGAPYSAEALDANGSVLPILPSIVLDGGVAQLSADNIFDVTAEPNQNGGIYQINSITVEVVNGSQLPVSDTIHP